MSTKTAVRSAERTVKTAVQAAEVGRNLEFLRRKSSAIQKELGSLPSYTAEDVTRWKDSIEVAQSEDIRREKVEARGNRQVIQIAGGEYNLNVFLQFLPLSLPESNVVWKALSRTMQFLVNALTNEELASAITHECRSIKTDSEGNLAETVPTVPELLQKVTRMVESFGASAEHARTHGELLAHLKTVKRAR